MSIVCLALVGCEKESTKEDEPKIDDRLVGTKWYCSDLVTQIWYGSNATDVYEFVSESEVEEYVISNNRVIHSEGTFEYTLDYPHLEMTRKHSDGTNYTYTFKDSRTMVEDGDKSGQFTYLRQ